MDGGVFVTFWRDLFTTKGSKKARRTQSEDKAKYVFGYKMRPFRGKSVITN